MTGLLLVSELAHVKVTLVSLDYTAVSSVNMPLEVSLLSKVDIKIFMQFYRTDKMSGKSTIRMI